LTTHIRARFDVIGVHFSRHLLDEVAYRLAASLAPKCPEVISIRLAMCRRHWFRVPLRLRHQLVAALEPGASGSTAGQLDGTAGPSETYLHVLQQCLKALQLSVTPRGAHRRRPEERPV